jgi:hypothetical protein
LWTLDFFITQPIWNNTRRAIIAGIMASLLYFSKSFGFPLALLLLLLSVFHHRITSTRMSRYNLLLGFAVFLFLSGFWIFLLSSKYSHFTISEAARLNVTKEVAPLTGQTVILPVVYSEGLIAPASSTALSAWEEPLQAVQLTDQYPLTSATDAIKRLDVIQRNLLSIWYFDFRRQAGGLFLIMMILVLIFNRRIINLLDPFTFYSLTIILLIYAGYSLILYHARYSWICTLLMVLLGIKWTDALFNSSSIGFKKLAWAMMLLFVLIAVKRPVKELLFSQDQSIPASSLFSAILSPFQTMKQTYAEDRAIFETAAMLDTLHGPLASRYSTNLERPRYFASLLVAQSCGQPYYGQVTIENAATDLSLKKNGIRYFLDWDHQEDSCFGHPPVFKNKTLSIFSADFSAKP